VFNVIYELASMFGDENAEVPLQTVYDEATVKLPAPPRGKRDTRQQMIRRAIVGLHERGYVTVHDDSINIGSPYEQEDAE
jgi:hypothetical protein